MTSKFNNETYFHINFNNNFTIVPNSILDNKNLTYQAIGIITQILRFQNSKEHKVYAKTLMSYREAGRTQVEKAIKELEKEGFISKTLIRNEKGHIKGYRYDIYDIPQIKPDVVLPDADLTATGENRMTVLPHTVKQQHINKINKKENINNIYVYKGQDEKVKEFSKLYQSNIGVINGLIATQLIEWSDILEVELFKAAIEICTERGNLNWGYLKGIIKNWLDNNITSLEKLEAHKLQQKNKNQCKNSMSKNNNNITKLPTRHHNINQSFSKYDGDELEKMLLESQKGKFK
ncbi:replication protein,DnaD domain protein,Replication initiation and membrane attachment [[Clostridium] sordellii]|uniref:DnaD domain-containing protein n=1 Tax=Paraclostridium sordellii TaxID=1505 RepID=UPI000543ABB2|nr:DnaD domain protein [Paeniclostridium sordellii]CEK35743.1 replication protein,DnaD domain protein,Replication initiation and membrane attachment [[Clostridium] sordellii] [Paeniclostridium sordellii]